MDSLGLTSLDSEVLPPYIANDLRSETLMVEIERKEQPIDLEEYANNIHPGEKLKQSGPRSSRI